MLLSGLEYWGCWGGAVALFRRWASRPVRCWVCRGGAQLEGVGGYCDLPDREQRRCANLFVASDEGKLQGKGGCGDDTIG